MILTYWMMGELALGFGFRVFRIRVLVFKGELLGGLICFHWV